MYSLLWRLLPGPRWLKAAQALVLALAVIAVLFLWVFPRVDPLLPFNQTTIDDGASHTVPGSPP